MSILDQLTVPKGGTVRFFNIPSWDFSWAIFIAKNPEAASPENFIQPGQVASMFTHDDGVSWPSGRAEALAVATLEQDGVVALSFVSLADAQACALRLRGGSR